MKFRKYVTGEAAGGLVKLIVIAVLIMILLPKLKSCVEEAPQVAANVASQAVDAAGNAISEMASDAVDAAEDKVMDTVCGIPVVGKACTPSNDSAAPDSTATEATATPAIPKPPQSTCLTLEQAAVVQLAQVRACTRITQVEFGGNLYARTQGGQTCHAGAPPFQGDTRSVVIPPVEIQGWKRVGTYHSHPRGKAGAYFSINDLCTYVSKKETGFVVATDDYSVFGKPLPGAGTDGEVRRFVPTKGLTFAKDRVLECLTRDPAAWSWLNLWTCPRLESSLDTNPSEVGTITKLDDLPRIADAPCRYSEMPKLEAPSYPSCMH